MVLCFASNKLLYPGIREFTVFVLVINKYIGLPDFFINPLTQFVPLFIIESDTLNCHKIFGKICFVTVNLIQNFNNLITGIIFVIISNYRRYFSFFSDCKLSCTGFCR